MIDMSKVNQGATDPWTPASGGQNTIQQQQAPYQDVGQGPSIQTIAPNPVDDLYKYGDYGQGARPNAWTNFGDYQDQWDAMGANIYRDPSWPGHLVWNPYQGWMDYGKITKALKGGYEGGIQGIPGFDERMGAEWWEDYNPADIYGAGVNEWPGSQPGGGGGGSAGGTDFPWQDWMNQGGTQEVPGQVWSEPYEAQQGTGYQYPWQWDTAGNTLSDFAQGMPMTTPQSWRQVAGLGQEGIQGGFQQSAPWAWTRAQELANQMIKDEGRSVGVDPWYEQAKSVAQVDIEDAIKQAAEQAGLSGLRWSTPMGRSAQDIAGRRMGEVGLEWTGREMQAMENARQREMESRNQLMGLGQGIAGLGENARDRQMGYGNMLMGVGQGLSGLEGQSMDRAMQAAGMLGNLGQMYDQAPQQWAQDLMGMGTQMWGQQQGAYDNAYQDAYRMFPENNPWLAQAFGMAGLQNNMVPQQYNPSFISQLFQGLFG